MIDLKFLRENPDLIREGIAKKHFECDLDAVYAMDTERRSLITKTEDLRSQQKSVNAEMASLQKGSPEFIAKVQEMRGVAGEVKQMEAELKELEAKWDSLYLTIPNIPHESVPVGSTPEDNVVSETWGDPESVSPHAKPHYDIEVFQRLCDFERGAKVTGAGFPFFRGDFSRLVRSLVNFFLDEARDNGYEELSCPLMVNADSATATGQLPDKEGQMYHVPLDGFYLIPTSEVPVTNFIRGEILDEADLPLYRTSYTPNFRREAGSYGKDVRGLNRVHQFDKVELVKWVKPETSFDELEKLRKNAEGILQKLGLPYRVLSICAGDLGFPHTKQYDLEVWAGGQKRWLEVSSCSNFTDFQARRANIRYRPKGGKPTLVHTLNGSGLAIPRTVAAILENYVQEDGRVKIPEVLLPYFGKEYLE